MLCASRLGTVRPSVRRLALAPLAPLAPLIRLRAMATATITLTPSEAQLASLLVDCASWVDAHPDEVDKLRLRDAHGRWIGKERGTDKVELRIAGGWVRDKLLGQQSDDIDVSTHPDPITGLKFATLFEKYLREIGQPELMGKLTKIEAKPDQSKHLETATANVCGLSLDWVQQRGTEVYTADSRIPTVSFGTPLEDAQRRDLTINALFYNLQSGQIEDQTGRGLQDLGLVEGFAPCIRTPMAPFETFQDDPLRVVRAVRFAARFGRQFRLDPELKEAIGREEIRVALRDPKKISRERVGIELEKMLLGNDPCYAMELIDHLELHPLIFLSTAAAFNVDPSLPLPEPDTLLSVSAARILADALSLPAGQEFSVLRPFLPLLHPLLTLSRSTSPPSLPMPAHSSHTTTVLSRANTRRLFLSAGLLPLYSHCTLEKAKPAWLGGHVVMDGIKGTGADKKWTDNARRASESLARGVRQFGAAQPPALSESEQRAEMGMLLKDLTVHDPLQDCNWNVSLLWSLVVDLVRHPAQAQELVQQYSRFTQRVCDFGLDIDAFAPPVLDGTEILATLPRAKGPAMTEMKEVVYRWQFGHPGEGKDACRAYLVSEDGTRRLDEALERAAKPRPKEGPTKKKRGKAAV